MLTILPHLRLALVAFVLAAGLISAQAQTQLTPQSSVSTPPIGYTTVNALGNSDTRLSAPLQRAPVWQGAVVSVSGTTITFNNVAGNGNFIVPWSANQFVYQAGTQSNTYYVLFLTGNKAGSYYTVTGNSAFFVQPGTITVDLNGDTIDGSNSAPAAAAGDSLCIIPYWTLSTLFPNQTGITTTLSPVAAGTATELLLYDATATGINPSFATYFYYKGTAGTGPGWRRLSGGTTNFNDQVLPPDQYFVVRQNGVTANTPLSVFGTAPLLTGSYALFTLAANQKQDIPLAINALVPLTLSQSGLFESGSFAGTTSPVGATGDQLLVYDDTVAGENKAFATYFYYTGAAGGGPGWRALTKGTTSQNNSVAFLPGSGFVIRKGATSAPATSLWNFNPPYAQ